MKLPSLIKSNEFLCYFIIGGLATFIDWSLFWLLANQLGVYYQLSLTCGYSAASLFHYVSNKIFTFGCQSKKIKSQFLLYFFVTLASLSCSVGVMGLLVSGLALEPLYARMLTTLLILFPNYLLHKYITFNKKIFLQPKTTLPMSKSLIN